MRRHDLDNIRWATVLLVAVYHVFYLFNACGVLGGVGYFTVPQYQDGFLIFVYPWFMILLFAIAGMCARYALETRPVKQFLRARTVKLLVPSTLGVFVFQWVVGYLNVYLGGGLESMRASAPVAVRYLIFALSGTGPLWFIQMLWLFSLVIALVKALDKGDRLYALCAKFPPAVSLLGCVVLWGGAQVGNMPVVTTYRFGVYFVAFLLGYFLLSHEKTRDFLARYRWLTLPVALAAGGVYVWCYFGSNYTSDVCLKSYFTSFYAWVAVLAILGCGKAWLGKANTFTAYMTRASYGVYILHYLFALLSCWALKTYTALPPAVIYPLAILLTLAGAFGSYELLRRIPVVRWCVLGMGKQRKSEGGDAL